MAEAEAEIAILGLTIEKLRRKLYGRRSERKERLLDQLELQLDELETSATEDELAADLTASGTTQVEEFTRRRPDASRSPSTCRVSAWSCRDRHPAPASARTGCRRSARSLRRRKIRASKLISDGLWVDWRQWAV